MIHLSIRGVPGTEEGDPGSPESLAAYSAIRPHHTDWPVDPFDRQRPFRSRAAREHIRAMNLKGNTMSDLEQTLQTHRR